MPDRAPTGRPVPWTLDPLACVADLDAFARLLAAKPELAEKADILPFFREHPHLAAFLGTYAYTANTVDQFPPVALSVTAFRVGRTTPVTSSGTSHSCNRGCRLWPDCTTIPIRTRLSGDCRERRFLDGKPRQQGEALLQPWQCGCSTGCAMGTLHS